MKRISAICALLVMTGCVTLEQENALGDAALDQKSLVSGLSKSEVLSCAGRPTSKKTVNGNEEWTYVYEAYKDPSLNRGWDANYIGISTVKFSGNTATGVTYGTNITRNSFGIPFPAKIIAGLSAPVYRNC